MFLIIPPPQQFTFYTELTDFYMCVLSSLNLHRIPWGKGEVGEVGEVKGGESTHGCELKRAAQRGEWWRSCSCHGNAWAERCEVGPVCFVVEDHMARWSSAPLPRYHRFNRLELLLRSVTTKWLQRLRRCWEPTERFTVGFITESVRFTATEMCLVAFLFLVGGEMWRVSIANMAAGNQNIFSSAHFDISAVFFVSAA